MLFTLRKYPFPFIWLCFSLWLMQCGQPDPSFTEDELSASEAEARGADLPEGEVMDPSVLDAERERLQNSPNGSGDENTANGDGSKSYKNIGDNIQAKIDESEGNGVPGGETGDGSGTGIGDGSGEETGDGTGGSGSGGDPGGEGSVNISKRTYETLFEKTENIDILWIVDSSGSMKEEQTYLGDNFTGFINSVIADDLNFQVALTSTDVCDTELPDDLSKVVCPNPNDNNDSAVHLRGKFIGNSGQQVLSRMDYEGNMQDLVDLFSSHANVGISGSGFEHGLWAAKLAIEKSLNATNPALIREDSFLSIIVVSDEEDDGIGLNMVDAYNGLNFHNEGLTTFSFTDDNMISFLNANVGEGNYSISSITGTRDNNGALCSSDHSKPQEEGTQYIKAAQKTGGTLESICENDWDSLLANIGKDIKAQTTQIVLPTKPYNVATIKVWVNDILVSDWEYISASKSIKFKVGAIPENNSTIKVEYYEVN